MFKKTWYYKKCTIKIITLFIAAFGKAALLYISYLSNWSSVKFDTSTLLRNKLWNNMLNYKRYKTIYKNI